MKKVVASIKSQFAVARNHPMIAIAALVVLVLLIGGVTALVLTGGGGVGGGDDGDDGAKVPDEEELFKELKKRKVKPAPVVSGSGTLDVSRAVGRLAIAQARGRIKTPAGVRVRVSAAPKQTVTVDYQISCYKAIGKTSQTKVGQARYRTRPPNERSIPLPMSAADECTVTVGAQLTRTVGSGRVKVAVIAG